MRIRTGPSRVLAWVYPIYRWLFWLPAAVFLTAFFSALAIVLSLAFSPRIGSTWAGRPWGRLLALLAPAPVNVVGRKHIDPTASYVIVANHSSTFDIFALYGWLNLDFRWVMKKELRRAPGLGAACAAVGHIFIDRSNTQAAIDTMKAAKSRIAPGTSVLFFPEGTRGPGEELLPFKTGAFHFAGDLALPILPISIIGAWRVLPEKSTQLFPGRISVLIHPPIAPPSPDKTLRQDLQNIMATTRATIAAPLSGSPSPAPEVQ